MSDERAEASAWRRELASASAEARAEAVVRLARAEGLRSEADVIARMSDPSLLVRIAAVAAFWELRAALRGAEHVVDGLHSQDEGTRTAAVEALSAIGEALMPALRATFEAGGQRSLIYPRALAEMASPKARSELDRLVCELHGEVADEARSILAELTRRR